jgi:hypothetical protein
MKTMTLTSNIKVAISGVAMAVKALREEKQVKESF